MRSSRGSRNGRKVDLRRRFFAAFLPWKDATCGGMRPCIRLSSKLGMPDAMLEDEFCPEEFLEFLRKQVRENGSLGGCWGWPCMPAGSLFLPAKEDQPGKDQRINHAAQKSAWGHRP